MTQEDKELLLKDLGGRLLYGVNVKVGKYGNPTKIWSIGILELGSYNRAYYNNGLNNDSFSIERIKPYLRPMSSMTDEEFKTYEYFLDEDGLIDCSVDVYVDWLLEGYFDFRGLIPKGLALEAPEGMYVIK